MTSEQCKAHGAQCRLMAQTAASSEQKTILLDLAREWERMAEQMGPMDPNEGKRPLQKSA